MRLITEYYTPNGLQGPGAAKSLQSIDRNPGCIGDFGGLPDAKPSASRDLELSGVPRIMQFLSLPVHQQPDLDGDN